MARKKRPAATGDALPNVGDYRHDSATRKDNPPERLAAEGIVPALPKAAYAYSPRLPPVLRWDGTRSRGDL
jgi:adenine-specific DNA-methyltransferase